MIKKSSKNDEISCNLNYNLNRPKVPILKSTANPCIFKSVLIKVAWA